MPWIKITISIILAVMIFLVLGKFSTLWAEGFTINTCKQAFLEKLDNIESRACRIYGGYPDVDYDILDLGNCVVEMHVVGNQKYIEFKEGDVRQDVTVCREPFSGVVNYVGFNQDVVSADKSKIYPVQISPGEIKLSGFGPPGPTLPPPPPIPIGLGNRIGTNFAGEWNTERFLKAAKDIGPGGWVALDATPSDQSRLQEIYNANAGLGSNAVNIIIIRRQHSGAGEAAAYANMYANLNTYGQVIYDVLGNEETRWYYFPNMDALIKYAQDSVDALDARGIKRNKVRVLNPAWDPYFTDEGSNARTFHAALGNAIDAYAVNVYLRFDGVRGGIYEGCAGGTDPLGCLGLPKDKPAFALEGPGILYGYPKCVSYPYESEKCREQPVSNIPIEDWRRAVDQYLAIDSNFLGFTPLNHNVHGGENGHVWPASGCTVPACDFHLHDDSLYARYWSSKKTSKISQEDTIIIDGRQLKRINLENENIKVSILPELGGRIYEFINKKTGHDQLYKNPVLKRVPNWGINSCRPSGGWMAAGGIEFAFPEQEHGCIYDLNWDYQIVDGGQSVLLSHAEQTTGLKATVKVTLSAGRNDVEIKSTIENPTANSVSYQYWTNAMLAPGGMDPLKSNIEFVFPTDKMIVHGIGDGSLQKNDQMSWPVHNGKDYSRYRNWNTWLGVFVPDAGSKPNCAGTFNYDNNEGVLIRFQNNIARGVKLFGPSSQISVDTYTVSGGNSYIEIWNGLTSTFDDYTTINPGQKIEWTMTMEPVNNINSIRTCA